MGWDAIRLSDDGAPKWFQIANILRQSIVEGEFQAGDVMPTEAHLNDVFDVSRTTARSALNKLVQEGLITRRSGVGSIVLGGRVDQPVNQIRGFTEDMLLRGLKPSFSVLSAGWEQASGEVAHALGLASSDKPFRSDRLLRANDRLMGYSVSWIRPDLFGSVAPPTEAQLAGGSLYAWLRENLDVEISGGVEFIEANLASEEIARLLDVEPASAVLVVTRIAKSASGMPVEFAVVTYRADRYRFRVEL